MRLYSNNACIFGRVRTVEPVQRRSQNAWNERVRESAREPRSLLGKDTKFIDLRQQQAPLSIDTPTISLRLSLFLRCRRCRVPLFPRAVYRVRRMHHIKKHPKTELNIRLGRLQGTREKRDETGVQLSSNRSGNEGKKKTDGRTQTHAVNRGTTAWPQLSGNVARVVNQPSTRDGSSRARLALVADWTHVLPDSVSR